MQHLWLADICNRTMEYCLWAQ